MIIDLETYDGPDRLQSDICIVGAGAAGITLALELAGTGQDVCILESGGLQYDVETQALAEGEVVGLPYYDLIATRLRFLGGTTNHWQGICRPLDDLDFRKRDHVPYSGWPISRAELDPYYRRAHEYCDLGPYDYSLDRWASAAAPPLWKEDSPVATKIMLEQPVRFGRDYRAELEGLRDVRIFLNANVTEFAANPAGNYVERVNARTLDGRELFLSARRIVLATGGIENARLLLSSTAIHPEGIGNDNDLVGRFFMEHPMFPAIELQLTGQARNLLLYTGRRESGMGVTGYISLADEVLRREGMLHAAASLNIGGVDQPIAKSLQGIGSAVAIWNALKEGGMPPSLGKHVGRILADLNRVVIYSYERAFERAPDLAHMVVQLEQAPNPSSRVFLSDERDQLGMRRVNLDWQMGDLERHTVKRLAELLALEIGRAELGRLQLREPEANGWWAGTRGAWHHMGTTRMHDDPRQGVVDADCRVHGVDNLYVAGSSVFTTSGFANPTLTLVALAVRLADHLKDHADA